PSVLKAMLPYFREHFGNPSSTHERGKTAHAAVDRARQQVAEFLGAEADEIVFTGGGSEASNQALKGIVFAQLSGFFGRWASGAHVITSAIEHPATLQPCEFLRRLGCRITLVPVDGHGCVDPDAVRTAIDRRTLLVTIVPASNEVGTVQPIH